ncbi:hypothetical protein RCL1_007145 [Eukaryota sp. TZLM3-RCL]
MSITAVLYFLLVLQTVMAFQTVAQGSFSTFPNPSVLLINKPSQENIIRSLVTSPLDLSNESYIAAFMGEQNSGGYSIQIVSVVIEDNKVSVDVKYATPPPDSFNIMAITSPFHIVKIPKVDASATMKVNHIGQPAKPPRTSEFAYM